MSDVLEQLLSEPVSRETFSQLDAVTDAIASHHPIAVATLIDARALS